jgi:hypothetical protein
MPDQIGGEDTRKYGPARIREMIVNNQTLTMPQFNDLFSKDFEDYMGKNKQIDDVILIGIEF